MILIKSIVAGQAWLILAAFVSLVGAIIALAVFAQREGTETVGIDPISVVRNTPILWVVAAVVFFLGFFWEFRRASP